MRIMSNAAPAETDIGEQVVANKEDLLKSALMLSLKPGISTGSEGWNRISRWWKLPWQYQTRLRTEVSLPEDVAVTYGNWFGSPAAGRKFFQVWQESSVPARRQIGIIDVIASQERNPRRRHTAPFAAQRMEVTSKVANLRYPKEPPIDGVMHHDLLQEHGGAFRAGWDHHAPQDAYALEFDPRDASVRGITLLTRDQYDGQGPVEIYRRDSENADLGRLASALISMCDIVRQAETAHAAQSS